MKKIKAVFVTKKTDLINKEAEIIKRLGYLEVLIVEKKKTQTEKVISAYIDGIEIDFPTDGLIDKEKELIRIEKEIQENEKKITEAERNLANKNFIERAPKAIIDETKEKLRSGKEAIDKLNERKKAMLK